MSFKYSIICQWWPGGLNFDHVTKREVAGSIHAGDKNVHFGFYAFFPFLTARSSAKPIQLPSVLYVQLESQESLVRFTSEIYIFSFEFFRLFPFISARRRPCKRNQA